MSWGPLPIQNVCIKYSDYLEYGCPTCGSKKGFPMMQTGRVSLIQCSECENTYWLCGDEVEENERTLAINNVSIIEHPRKVKNV